MIYLLIVVLAFVFELAYFKIASKYNIVDRPSERGSAKGVSLCRVGLLYLFGLCLSVVHRRATYDFVH